MARSLLVSTGTSALMSGVLILLMAMPAAGQSSAELVDAPHCIVRLADADPTDKGGEGIIEEERCFTTFSAAFEYGSLGAIDVPADMSSADLTQSLVLAAGAQSSSYLIGINYDCKNFTTNWLCPSWSWFASGPCSPTSGWYVNSVGSAQDNRYESVRTGYSYCKQVRVFEHINLQGANLHSWWERSDLGLLNNHTSSVRWWGY
ncbi:MAG TPA: hypothetical protein VLA05_07620 [Coriobacteriia bacterium]|nr:hypothetical protein [Coriobacteriia bacterium]